MSRASAGTVSIALAFLLLGSGCRPAPDEARPPEAGATPLSAADVAAIHAADTAFSSVVATGDAAGIAGMYLADASLMPPNTATIVGRDGIQKFWGGFVDAYRIKLTLVADEVEGRGDLAYWRGRYIFDLTPKAQGQAPSRDEGKSLAIYRRQADGTWRLAVDMYSSDLPAPK